ncbi:DUF1893 domain-containing protein [Candidatus Bathyarchaeota archaeon]|nr:DUF1893 domain-containing protein [Candidatus Bathyarchaeota archaeon]NIU80734.1 DUF1893 domain-containing protein [Candidatus Bathyarchaeota archaeon]NIV67361.1 DUF1893 domain-containing protein [Candidatus Bathyarchaeota archaeon]
MQDLDRARLRLKEKELSLVIFKSGELLFETDSHGIKGFLEATQLLGSGLAGSSVADRIVGRAVAFLCAYFKVSSVFAVIMSEKAADVLVGYDIPCRFERCVPDILNQAKEDVCPFEKLAAGFATPEEAYRELRSLLQE